MSTERASNLRRSRSMTTNFNSSRRGFALLTLNQDGIEIKTEPFLTADAAIQTALSRWSIGDGAIFHVVNLDSHEHLLVGESVILIGTPLTENERRRYGLARTITMKHRDQAILDEIKPITGEVVHGNYPHYNPAPTPALDYWTGFLNGLDSRLNGDYNDSYLTRLRANRFDELDCVGYEFAYWLREQKYKNDQRFNPPQVFGINSNPIIWTDLKP